MKCDFLDVADLSADELEAVLALSAAPIERLGAPLASRGVALIFEKPSNRTRQSMEMAVVQLGGHPVYTRGEEVGFDVREPVEDIARIMSGYHSVLAARVFSHSVVELLAASAPVSVVNLLSDRSHPMQALADMLTMQQALGDMGGRTIAYVGDFNNVARSLCEISVRLGVHVRLGCPAGYDAQPDELERLDRLGEGTVEQVIDPIDAVTGACVVHTDSWTSMGQEHELQSRNEVFGRYQVTSQLMSAADGEAMFMHCLPAHRGFEVSAEVIDGSASLVVAQGHNRMHTSRGLLAFVLGVRP
jgi:ornithine carbamoyltransferase